MIVVRKIIKNEKNEYVWVITVYIYRRNVDWIYIEEYRKDAGVKEIGRDTTVLDRKEYTALFDFIDTYCPYWESTNEMDQFGEQQEVL